MKLHCQSKDASKRWSELGTAAQTTGTDDYPLVFFLMVGRKLWGKSHKQTYIIYIYYTLYILQYITTNSYVLQYITTNIQCTIHNIYILYIYCYNIHITIQYITILYYTYYNILLPMYIYYIYNIYIYIYIYIILLFVLLWCDSFQSHRLGCLQLFVVKA